MVRDGEILAGLSSQFSHLGQIEFLSLICVYVELAIIIVSWCRKGTKGGTRKVVLISMFIGTKKRMFKERKTSCMPCCRLEGHSFIWYWSVDLVIVYWRSVFHMVRVLIDLGNNCGDINISSMILVNFSQNI